MLILVADDHEFTRSITRRLLVELGQTDIIEAHDGASALEAARKDRPDIVISDLNMPGMDGMTFIRHLAKDKLADSLIVLSGLGTDVLSAVESMAVASGLRVLGALRKPIRKEALVALLHLHENPDSASSGEIDKVGVERGLVLGEFSAWFSPVIDVETRRPVAAALNPRWESKTFGTLMDADVTRPVTSAGAAPAVTRQLGNSALLSCAQWRQAGWKGAVELPMGLGDFADDGLLDWLAAQARINQLPNTAISIGIDGAIFGEDVATASFAMARALMLSFGVTIHLRTAADLDAIGKVKACGALTCPAAWGASDRGAMARARDFARGAHATFGVTGVDTPEALAPLAEHQVQTARGAGVGAPSPADARFIRQLVEGR